MSKVYAFMQKLLETIIPPIGNFRMNHKINPDVIDPEFREAVTDTTIPIRSIEERYLNTLKIKDKLEDKAKFTGAAITISITLMMGSTNFLSSINHELSSLLQIWISFAGFVIAVVYMITAGILSYQLLMNRNELFIVKLKKHKDDCEYRKELCKCTSQNQKLNQIRNNFIFTSYECTRNAIILLLLIFAVRAIPTTPQNTLMNAETVVTSNDGSYVICYTPDAFAHVYNDSIQKQLESAITVIAQEDVMTWRESLSIGLHINDSEYFIKFSLMDEHIINILEIEPFTYYCDDISEVQ